MADPAAPLEQRHRDGRPAALIPGVPNHGAGRPAAPAVPRSVACCTPRARKAAFIRGIARLIADARIRWTGPTFDAAGVAPAIVAGGEEETLQARVSHQAQAQGVPVNVVDRPALSSFIARSTHRDRAQACVFVTSPVKDGEAALDGPMLARARQIVVISMGIEGLAAIARRLVQHGMPPPRPWPSSRTARQIGSGKHCVHN